MARQVKTFTIDGSSYTISQLGALKGRKIWLKLVQLMAAPMREMAKADHFDEQSIMGALAAGVENLDEATLEELYEAFGEACTIAVSATNNPALTGVVFDNHFAGNYQAMSVWLFECVKFNFAGFLDGASSGTLASMMQKATAMRQAVNERVGGGTKSPVPQTASTGSSSES